MTLQKILPVLAGFAIIGLLSSLFAALQGYLFPQTLTMLGQPAFSMSEVIQLLIKLITICFSCLLGGMLTTVMKGTYRASLIVGMLILIVIIWLWINTIYPVWFWAILTVLINPSVLLGHKIVENKRSIK